MQSSFTSRYEQLAATLHRLMALYGYERLETPILQPADLFLTRAGDQIITRLFTFEHAGTQVALRPEYTSPAMSRYIHDGWTTPVRWQFGGMVFEEADDVARQQRSSIGAEAIGWPVGLADAEIVALAVAGLQRAGVPDLVVHVGHVALLRALLGRYVKDARMQRFLLNHVQTLRQPGGRDLVWGQITRLLRLDWQEAQAAVESPSPAIVDALLQPLERSQLMGGRSREDIQRRLLEKLERAEAISSLEQGLDELERLIALEGPRRRVIPALRAHCASDSDALRILDEWEAILLMAEALGVDGSRIVLNPALSRNWDYYSGLVFELHSAERHLGGGGRYDDLARLLGADRPVAAVGFAYYADDVLDALPSSVPAGRIWTLRAEVVNPALAIWLAALRDRGVAVAVNPEAGNLSVNAAGELEAGERRFTPAEADAAVAWLEAQP